MIFDLLYYFNTEHINDLNKIVSDLCCSLFVSSLGKVRLGPTLTSTPLKSLLMEEGMSLSLGFMSRMMESPFV